MSAPKFLLAGAGLLRARRAIAKCPLSQPLRLCSSSAAPQTPPPLHPWPEWVAFVDSLRTQGYLSESPVTEDGVYMEMDVLEDPCLRFARGRGDLFGSLSSEDIRAVVEAGCPNILRKVVNSAKRLRAHLKLDEQDVCGSCNLRGLCDRAYAVLKDFEPPHTMDVMRLLMFSAADPLLISGGKKPPGRELAEVGSRKLLSKLVELSESSPGPKSVRQTATAPNPSKESSENFDDDMSSEVDTRKGERMCPKDRPENASHVKKEGDWICSKCNFMNFAKNRRCRECSADGPVRIGDGVEMKKGDWYCPRCHFMNFASNKQCKSCRKPRPTKLNDGEWECHSCNFMNFSRNRRCLECGADGPERVADNVEMKKGDWICPNCSFMNFASNMTCKYCKGRRPRLNPGEWECPSCDFFNFSNNEVCRKCKSDRPQQEQVDQKDQQPKSPH